MFDKYLVTGATGFLGRAVADELVRRRAQVYALVLHNDPYINLLPKEVHTVIGDVCDESSLADFFADADGRTCVIHCAGIVSVASRPGPKLYQVNVGGTWRVLRQCMEHDVGKMVYVSSVHAIPEKPKGCIITEDCEFSPGLVDGDYAKSKAVATELVLNAAERGLNASIVLPSGIIGPGDIQGGSFTSMAKSFLAGKLPLAVRAEVSPHLPAAGACKAGRSVLRTPKPEGAEAAVFHPIFRFRSCLKRPLQPCCCVGTLCISAAPGGGDFAGHDCLAFGAEEKGRSVTLHQQKAPWAGCACY